MENVQSCDLSWQPQAERKPILDKVSVTLAQGGFYGIIGPNGSGKTSLLKHILRFIESKKGDILFDGKRIQEFKRKDLAKRIAFVPQNTVIDTAFSAYDIVFMGRAPHQKRFQQITAEDKKIVQEAMRLAACEELKEKEVRTLSGGEAQRVAIARAIAQATRWLFLDEPIASLDIRHQLELMNTLAYLNSQKGVSIAAVLHDINICLAYCNHVIMMKEGRVYYEGRTEDVMTPSHLEEIYDVPFITCTHPDTGKPYYIAQPVSVQKSV